MVQVPAEFAAEIADTDCNYTITVMRRNNILQLENVQNKIFSDRDWVRGGPGVEIIYLSCECGGHFNEGLK